jgi:hypothetical protein
MDDPQSKNPQLEALHIDAVRIADSLRDLKTAVDQHWQSYEQSNKTNPVVTDLRTNVPIQVDTRSNKTKPEWAWAILKGSLEIVAGVAIIAYTFFSYSQWQEMMTANDISMGNSHQSRIAANEQFKLAQHSLDASTKSSHVQERAWVTVPNVDLTVLKPNEVVRIRAELLNTGSTIAKSATTIGGMQIAPKSVTQLPPGHSVKAGPFFPNARDFLPFRSIDPISPEAFDHIVHGDMVITIWFTVTYRDVFEHPHTTHYEGQWSPEAQGFTLCATCKRYAD